MKPSSVLKKIFADGFYRMHSGMLVFIFIALVSYCLFINTLGVVPADQVDFWQFFFTISVVSNPLILGFYLIACMWYAYKSYTYIADQLHMEVHHFLRYSFNAMSPKKQFLAWLVVQVQICIPVLTYTLYAVVIGIVFNYYLLSVAMIGFQLLLLPTVAYFCYKTGNQPLDARQSYLSSRFTFGKPIFLLYTFQVLNRAKLAYLLTKLLSWILLSSVFLVFADLKGDLRLMMLITSCIVMAHAFLIYQERKFNDRYLSFIFNFPFSKSKLFLGSGINYLILLLPEISWLISRFPLLDSVQLLAITFSMVYLFKSVLLLNGLTIKGFLIWIFCLFFASSGFILFGYGLLLIPINLTAAWIIFARNHLNSRISD